MWPPDWSQLRKANILLRIIYLIRKLEVEVMGRHTWPVPETCGLPATSLPKRFSPKQRQYRFVVYYFRIGLNFYLHCLRVVCFDSISNGMLSIYVIYHQKLFSRLSKNNSDRGSILLLFKSSFLFKNQKDVLLRLRVTSGNWPYLTRTRPPSAAITW